MTFLPSDSSKNLGDDDAIAIPRSFASKYAENGAGLFLASRAKICLDALSTSHSTFFRSLLGTFLLPELHVEFVLLRLYGPHLRWLNNQLRLI